MKTQLRWIGVAWLLAVLVPGWQRAPGQTPASMFSFPNVVATVPAPFTGSFDGPLLHDFTNDGIPDALFLTTNPTTLVLFVTNAVGNVTIAPSPFPGFTEDVLAGAADVNLDGSMDVIAYAGGTCATQPCSSGLVRVYLNAGGGAFVAQPAATGFPLALRDAVAVADLNHDGATEVVVVGADPTNAPVVRVASIDPFTAVPTLGFLAAVPSHVAALCFGDFDGDNLEDLALGTASSESVVRVLFQATGLAFGNSVAVTLTQPINAFCTTWPVPQPCIGAVKQLAAGDVDGDGVLDLFARGTWMFASGGNSNATFWLLRGPFGAHPAAAGQNVNNLSVSHRILVADLDRDDLGIDELLIDWFVLRPNVYPVNVMIAALSPIWSSNAVERAQGLVDLDSDGDLDLVGAYRFYASGCPWPCYSLRFLVHENLTITGGSCGSPGLHNGAGVPSVGNPAFALTLAGAEPYATAALYVSLGSAPTAAGPCLLGLDLAQLVPPSAPYAVVPADASGNAFVPVPLPVGTMFSGVHFFTQWLALDPAGPLVVVGSSFSLSALRKVVVF